MRSARSPRSPRKPQSRAGDRAAHSAFWRKIIALDKRSAKSFIRINDRIRAREIRVIDENGEQLGILPPFEALKIARERGLDLVEVSRETHEIRLPRSRIGAVVIRDRLRD